MGIWTWILGALMWRMGEALHWETAIQTLLFQHNVCRAQEGADLEPVDWDRDLAASAQRYATILSLSNCAMHHSTSKFRENIPGWEGELAGENLMWGENGAWRRSLADVMEIIRESPRVWCKERRHYNFRTTKCRRGKECGHYTQMVWHDLTHIGCGLSFCRRPATAAILVCHYQPGGNWVGQPPYNKTLPDWQPHFRPSTYRRLPLTTRLSDFTHRFSGRWSANRAPLARLSQAAAQLQRLSQHSPALSSLSNAAAQLARLTKKPLASVKFSEGRNLFPMREGYGSPMTPMTPTRLRGSPMRLRLHRMRMLRGGRFMGSSYLRAYHPLHRVSRHRFF